MSELPKGWSLAKLETVVEILDSQRSPVSSKERLLRTTGKNDSDLYPYYGATGKAGVIDDYLFDEELIALGEDGVPFFDPTKHKAYMLYGKTWVNNHAHVLKAINGITFNKYVCEFLNQFDYMGYVNGGTRLKLTQANMRKINIPVAPLAEQKRIVEKLDQVLAQVDTIKARLDSIPAILKRFRQSVLAAAVSGKLTEEWRDNATYPAKDQLYKKLLSDRKRAWLQEQEKSYERKEKKFNLEVIGKKYKEPMTGFSDELDLTQINSVPKEWLISNLDSVSIAVTGKTPSTSDEKNWNGKVPFISPSQILPEGEVVDPERFVSEFAYSSTPILPVNSVLIVCIGTIGKVGFLKKESAFNQQINALIPSDSIKSKFLFIWAKTLHEWLNKTSSAIVNAAIINKSRLCSAPCPVPSLEEQTEIVRLVDQYFAFADIIEKQVQKAQQRVDKLTQSILAKAFRGELVPQDPSDEPADELLKRIAAARAESEALAKAAKKAGKKTEKS
ncbi:MAG: restriction endonuclease subunit S [Marinomonas foliarum]